MSAFDRWAETARKASRGERTDTVRLARQTFNEMKSDRNFQWLKKYVERRLPTAEIHPSSSGGSEHQSAPFGGTASSSLGFLDLNTVYYLLVLCDPTDIPTRLLRISQMLENEVGRISIETAGLLLLSTIAGKCGSLGDFVSAFEHQLRKLLIILLENRKKLPQVPSQGRKRDSGPPKRRNTRAGTVLSVTSAESCGHSGTFAIAGSGSSFPQQQNASARSPPVSPISTSIGASLGVLPLAFSGTTVVKNSRSKASGGASRTEDGQLPQSKSWVVEQLGLQRQAMLNSHVHEDPYLTSPGTSTHGSFGGLPVTTGAFQIGRQGGGLAVDTSYTPDDHALGAPSRPQFDLIDPMRTAGVLSDCESTGTVGTEAAATGVGVLRSSGISAPAVTMREALILLIALIAKQTEGPAEKLLEQAREHVPEFPDPQEERDAMVTISLSFTLIHGVASFLDVQGQNWEIRADSQAAGLRRGSYHAPPPLAPASPSEFLGSASAGDYSRSRASFESAESFLLTSNAVKRLFNLNGDGEPASARGVASPLVPAPDFAKGTKVLVGGVPSSPVLVGNSLDGPPQLSRTRSRQNSDPGLKLTSNSLGVPSGRRGSMLPPPIPSADEESSPDHHDEGSGAADAPKEQDQTAAAVAIDFTAFSGEASRRNSVADPLYDSSRALASADLTRESGRKISVASEGTTQPKEERAQDPTEDEDFSDREDDSTPPKLTKGKYKSKEEEDPPLYDDEDHSPIKLPTEEVKDVNTAVHRPQSKRQPAEGGCGACCVVM